MNQHKGRALTGDCNRRMVHMEFLNNQYTMPLVDVGEVISNTNVTIPPEDDIIRAKKWVDNGSRL